jgi:hypothetical protein
MINIRIKGPNSQQETASHASIHFPIDKPRIWIGRGEDVAEKEGRQSYALNLAAFSKAVSRLHACLLLSPAFFNFHAHRRPPYFDRLGGGWKAVGE